MNPKNNKPTKSIHLEKKQAKKLEREFMTERKRVLTTYKNTEHIGNVLIGPRRWGIQQTMHHYAMINRDLEDSKRMEYINALDSLEHIFPASVLTTLTLEYAKITDTDVLTFTDRFNEQGGYTRTYDT